MSYATLMVHLDGARSNAAVLEVAATLARRHGAGVIGIAACRPVPLGVCGGYLDGELAVIEHDIVIDDLARAKVECHAHAGLKPHLLAWHSIPTLKNVAHIAAAHARCADLVITGAGPARGDLATHADAGTLILRAGRPVLVVPEANATADFRTVVVAWTDTRECRRAVADALPVLRAADRVIVVEVTADPIEAADGAGDVVAWLGRHGVDGDRIVAEPKGSAIDTLAAIAVELDADLVVAGAYGHSRVREWTFGGVTRDLLLHDRRCTLLSH